MLSCPVWCSTLSAPVIFISFFVILRFSFVFLVTGFFLPFSFFCGRSCTCLTSFRHSRCLNRLAGHTVIRVTSPLLSQLSCRSSGSFSLVRNPPVDLPMRDKIFDAISSAGVTISNSLCLQDPRPNVFCHLVWFPCYSKEVSSTMEFISFGYKVKSE